MTTAVIETGDSLKETGSGSMTSAARLEFNTRRALGVSLVCASALVFQVFSTRILSIVLSEQLILFSISFALLGMGVAASFVSIGKKETRINDRGLGVLALLLTLSFVLAFYLSAQLSMYYNTAIKQAVAAGGGDRLFSMMRDTMLSKMWTLGSILFIPYVLFGLFVALFFKSSRAEDYHRFYAADLFGAASGSVLAMIALDAFGFRGGLGLTLGTSALAACLFLWRASKPLAEISLAILAAVTLISSVQPIARQLEASPSIEMLSRNFENDRTANETWTRWNAHSRIAKLEVPFKDGTYSEVYAHEGGDGWAFLNSTKPDRMYKFAAVLEPKDILVLFAGVGADMQQLDEACGGTCNITGVEINRQMVEHALRTDTATREFLAKPNISLDIAEAREHLERDHKKYDSILLSWWGAGASFFMGTSGHLAEYLYTKEALGTLLDHLAPDGTIVIFNGSKIQLVATLAEIFKERGMEDLESKLLIMRPNGLIQKGSSGFYDTPESMRLILKPAGFTSRDIDRIERFAASVDMSTVIGPHKVTPGYEPYANLAAGMPVEKINGSLRKDFGIEVSVPVDSRPFINDLTPKAQYFDLGRLFFASPDDSPTWLSTRNIFLFILTLSLISAVLIIAPVSLSSGPRWSGKSMRYLAYFSAIGAGFMLIEVGMLRKLGLLLGHPSYAISIVLASLILSTGIGSLYSPKLEQAGLTNRKLALFVFAYILAFVLVYPLAFDMVIALPFLAKALVAVMAIFPLGAALGQFFPRGLRDASSIDERLVPWAWAVNGTLSTIASALAVYLSYPLGFDWIILMGGAAYLVILLTERNAGAGRAVASGA